MEDHYYSASSETYYFHVNEKEINIPRTKLKMQVKSHDNQKNIIRVIVKK